MAKYIPSKKEEIEEKIDCDTICLRMALNANFTRHITRNYNDQVLTLEEWKVILKKERAIQ